MINRGAMIRRPIGQPGPVGTPMQQGPMPVGRSMMTRPILGSYKKGGKVKKTGIYKLHRGERVMPTKLSSLVKA